ncbi:MAG: hypothetical protein JWL58_7235 [Streptosporangiaceae bacterium]|jgi:hypothetical protein|nr:hypothetical protein [Streptosporangiaceae bacterium]
MPLRLIALDPDTDGGDCPAVFLDTDSGDLVFQGWTVTDPAALAEVNGVSRIADNESVVRLPTRMRKIVLNALLEAERDRPGEDPV